MTKVFVVDKPKGSAMLALGLLGWIIVGVLAGWAMVRLLRLSDQQAISRVIALGVAGGVVGGLAVALTGADGHSGPMLCTFPICLIGSVLTIVVGRKVLAHNAQSSRRV